ncbi:rhodanese-like domain-containing protein [Sporolactobacillus laevolacticus]|uniref:rhodanese-like domain-containing protein n=1 Tax=Sporolactobacillus laevolacticus TaxID=33018 RepID=UPI0025B32467|nr:rhodanese-like domain-containing protein [Sporolactobacillus laevolacticus]MDN3956385.1 rhodanese-like domain-containing protein [Sporolactobacillus laevolacticus]
MFEEISPYEVELLLAQGKADSIIDVREADEFESGHIPGAVNISVNVIQSSINQIDKGNEHIIVCHSGGRSGVACTILASYGYNVKNMTGGMLEWTGEIEY